ncbi:unnamed protein product [Caenorhabditis brenneri]
MSLITSLFCPLCQKPYDDEDRRPRLGSCRHTVCQLCIETKKPKESVPPRFPPSDESTKIPDCPICDEKNAFKEVTYNFELSKMLEAFNEKVTEESFQRISDNPKKLDLGVCRSCFTTERLRMCMTCAEKSQLFKKLPNGKYQIEMCNKPSFVAKSIYFCSDCIADGQPDHQQHLFLPLAKIEMREMDLEFWHYIIHAQLLNRKIDEIVHRPIHNNAQYFKRYLFIYKQQALNYEVIMRSNLFRQEEYIIKLRFKKNVDIMSIPELARAKEKSLEEAQKVINRYMKLQERQLWWHKYRINMIVERYRQYKYKDPTIVKFKEDFSALATKFNTFQITELSQSEADKIDELCDAKVEEAIQKLDHLPNFGADNRKFYAYKAIYNLLQNQVDREEKIKIKLKKESEIFLHFVDNRYEQIEEKMKKDPMAQRLFLFEITDRSLKIDKLRIENLETKCGWREGELIWERWFPDFNNPMSEDSYYYCLLQQKFHYGLSASDVLLNSA